MVDPHLPQLPDEITFASELIKARNDLGMTQAQLAEKSRLSVSAIKSYESGRNMPGARELRELCQALQISPNKLLFGTELPFQARSLMNILAEDDTEDQLVLRMRLASMTSLLASDERESVYTLVRSLAIARHGDKKVQELILGSDALTGMSRILAQKTRAALNTNTQIDAGSAGTELEQFLERQGHIPPQQEKLPKK